MIDLSKAVLNQSGPSSLFQDYHDLELELRLLSNVRGSARSVVMASDQQGLYRMAVEDLAQKLWHHVYGDILDKVRELKIAVYRAQRIGASKEVTDRFAELTDMLAFKMPKTFAQLYTLQSPQFVQWGPLPDLPKQKRKVLKVKVKKGGKIPVPSPSMVQKAMATIFGSKFSRPTPSEEAAEMEHLLEIFKTSVSGNSSKI